MAATGVEADAFAHAFAGGGAGAVRQPGASRLKSVAAYRAGLDLDPARPSEPEVTESARRWLARTAGALADPVLVRHLLWTAADLGLPLQLHTGFGDRDMRLHRIDPSLLTDWLRLPPEPIPVLLLHCWPYQRQAALPGRGLRAGVPRRRAHPALRRPARARTMLAEAMEITPFRKLLYCSDAYGLAEFYQLGALAFRHGLARLLQDRVDADELSLPDALRISRWMGRDNACRVYGLPL